MSMDKKEKEFNEALDKAGAVWTEAFNQHAKLVRARAHADEAIELAETMKMNAFRQVEGIRAEMAAFYKAKGRTGR